MYECEHTVARRGCIRPKKDSGGGEASSARYHAKGWRLETRTIGLQPEKQVHGGAARESVRCRAREGLAGRRKIRDNPTFVGCKCNFR
jgi:hypothetical protein